MGATLDLRIKTLDVEIPMLQSKSKVKAQLISYVMYVTRESHD